MGFNTAVNMDFLSSYVDVYCIRHLESIYTLEGLQHTKYYAIKARDRWF